MTRKHFMAIAATIALSAMNDKDKSVFASEMADTLAEFNNLFDRVRFMNACFPASDAEARRMLVQATK